MKNYFEIHLQRDLSSRLDTIQEIVIKNIVSLIFITLNTIYEVVSDLRGISRERFSQSTLDALSARAMNRRRDRADKH